MALNTGPTNGAKTENGKPTNGDRGRRSPPLYKLPSNTFDAQGSLPRLPIPTLDETMTKFVATVAALQTAEEQEETQKLVQDFRRGDGPKLQQLLVDYEAEGAKNGTFGSYVEEFWNDSYLAPDSSVVLNLNPYFILEKVR